jgi:hypothetical protein
MHPNRGTQGAAPGASARLDPRAPRAARRSTAGSLRCAPRSSRLHSGQGRATGQSRKCVPRERRRARPASWHIGRHTSTRPPSGGPAAHGADRQRPGLPTSDTRCSTTRPWGPSAPCGGRGSTPSSSDRAGYLVLVLHLDDHAGTCLPDASLVHLDARPLVSCHWCAADKGIGQHPRRWGPRAAVGPRAVNLAVGAATRRSQ